MTKTILGSNGPKKAFSLSTLNPFKKQKPHQDTPKQDYILCRTCEDSFAVIERIIANEIHNLIEHDQLSSVTVTRINEDETAINFPDTDPKVLRLLIYSILFRCHISDLDFFKHFHLSSSEATLLKRILNRTVKPRQTDFLTHIATLDSNEFEMDIPYLLVTSSNHSKHTENVIFPLPAMTDPYVLYMSKYSLVVSLKKKAFSDNTSLINVNTRPCTIMDISDSQWDLQNRHVTGLLETIARRNLRK